MGWGVGGEDGNNVATPGFRQAQGCYWSFNFRWISETPVTSSLKVVTGLACDRHAALFWLSSPLPVCISVILHSITLDPLTPLSYLKVFYILSVSCLSFNFLLDYCFHLLFFCALPVFLFLDPRVHLSPSSPLPLSIFSLALVSPYSFPLAFYPFSFYPFILPAPGLGGSARPRSQPPLPPTSSRYPPYIAKAGDVVASFPCAPQRQGKAIVTQASHIPLH